MSSADQDPVFLSDAEAAAGRRMSGPSSRLAGRLTQRLSDRRGAIRVAALTALTAALLCGILLRLMTYELRRDEQLYATPAKLLESQRLYVDFFYHHVPGSAWLFYGVRRIFGSDHLLMDGRLSSTLAIWTAAEQGWVTKRG